MCNLETSSILKNGMAPENKIISSYFRNGRLQDDNFMRHNDFIIQKFENNTPDKSMTYWELIDFYRLKKGYSWYKLSKVSHVPGSTINSTKDRAGYLSFENTCKIALALEIDLNDLNLFKDN